MDICELQWLVQLKNKRDFQMHLADGGQGTTVFSLEKTRLLPQSPTRL